MHIARGSEKIWYVEKFNHEKIESSRTYSGEFINFISKFRSGLKIGSSTVNREKFRKKMVQRDVHL